MIKKENTKIPRQKNFWKQTFVTRIRKKILQKNLTYLERNFAKNNLKYKKLQATDIGMKKQKAKGNQQIWMKGQKNYEENS